MRRIALVLLAGVLCATACQDTTSSQSPDVPQVIPGPFNATEIARILRLSPLPEVALDPTNRWANDERAARFGQLLFFDPGLSKGRQHSCATCHLPDHGFADANAIGQGVAPLERHVPGLLNVAHHRWFMWDGRADTLWAQACAVIEAPL